MAESKHNGNGPKALHATETPDVSHIKNQDVTHEGSDVDVFGVLKFVLGLTVLTVVVFVMMWGLFRFFYAETEKEPSPGPMAMTEEERLPPPPRLQAARGFGVILANGERVNLEKKEPEAEYRVLREQWERQLNCSPDQESSKADTGCVPIDQAIEKVLQVGLPSRKQPNPRDSYGPTPPSAASSGRTQ
jgi:hypothetical protein